jgi:hypothetical protein
MAWREALGGLARFERPLKAFGKLASATLLISALGWFFSSLVQYNSWRQEHDLKRYQEDFDQANKTFAETSQMLLTSITLQQMLAFNYIDALQLKADDDKSLGFLSAQAKGVNDDYVKARIELRKSIELLARKTEIFVDWPSVVRRQKERSVRRALSDPLTIASVEASDIDCDDIYAKGDAVENWTSDKVSTKPGAPSIDWQSAKHHVIVLYACFDQDHKSTQPIRRWATGQTPGAPKIDAAVRKAVDTDQLKKRFNRQLDRLRNFMILSMTRIEQIRTKNEPPGYFYHLTGIGCRTV